MTRCLRWWRARTPIPIECASFGQTTLTSFPIRFKLCSWVRVRGSFGFSKVLELLHEQFLDFIYPDGFHFSTWSLKEKHLLPSLNPNLKFLRGSRSFRIFCDPDLTQINFIFELVRQWGLLPRLLTNKDCLLVEKEIPLVTFEAETVLGCFYPNSKLPLKK